MKEKIAEIVRGYDFEYGSDEAASRILSLIREEIEKVESLKGMYTKEHEKGFEQCRQAILKALES